ncbi:MAG: tetratricopeptide repeat protein [bacterium]|nr:MAG: tetratricopeptide repeat protein [bacterium]
MAVRWSDERAAIDIEILTLLEHNQYGRVVALADSAIGAGHGDPRILGQKAQALGSLGRYDESIAVFEKAIIGDYQNCENHLNFAVMLMRAGKTGRAITEFMVAKRFCPPNRLPLINRNLAVANIKLGESDQAMQYVRDGLRIDPLDPYLRGLEGMLVADSDPARAESLFVRLRQAGDVDPEFLYQFGLLLLRTERSGEAVEVLSAASKRRPGDSAIQINLAEALSRARRDDEAETVLRSLLDSEVGRDATRKLARLLFRQGRYAEALEYYRALPPTPESMDRIAMCLHGLGKLDEAIEWARRALEARPEWPAAMVNMAVILAASGELDEAESLLIRVLELEPDNMTARINLDRLRRARANEPSRHR